MAVCALLSACSSGDQFPTDLTAPVEDSSDDFTPPGTDPVDDTTDDVVDDGTPYDPLNLSFEWPRLADGEMGRPEAWSIDERGSAWTRAYSDRNDAADGTQYLVMDIQGNGARTWATSPVLDTLVDGEVYTLDFAMRSDCDGVVLTLLAGTSAAGFAVLPTASNWADMSFSLTPTASQVGKDFRFEIMNESQSACSFELDAVEIR